MLEKKQSFKFLNFSFFLFQIEAELREKKEGLLRSEQKLIDNEKTRGDLQRELNKTKSEGEELKQEMNYLQGLYKKEVKKTNEMMEKIEFLQENLRRKEKELQNQNEMYEDVCAELKSEKKRNNFLEEAKRINEQEKDALLNEKQILIAQIKENKEVDNEIIGILNTRKNSMKKFKF